jgi:hypothetical protein
MYKMSPRDSSGAVEQAPVEVAPDPEDGSVGDAPEDRPGGVG